MTNITMNQKYRTIELTKKFAADSSCFGTDEYKMLQEARRDYPNYKVVVVSRKNSKTNFDGLTLDYMEIYISKHDDDEHSIMNGFEILLARDDTSKAAGLQAAPYLHLPSHSSDGSSFHVAVRIYSLYFIQSCKTANGFFHSTTLTHLI